MLTSSRVSRLPWTPSAVLVLMALPLVLAACKPKGQVGEACVVEGDGFTRKDSCREMCVNWEVTCPDGRKVTPDVCSGVGCTLGSSCAGGQFCMQIDSFAENARCMPLAVCGLSAPPAATQMTLPPGDWRDGAEADQLLE